MNMFKPTKAKTIKQYIDAVPGERKEIILFLDDFIKKTVPKLKPHFSYNMLAYGKFPTRNYKKEMIEWPVISLANQKNYVSIYICAVDGDQYIAEKYKKDLGKVNVGRSCVRFRNWKDVNLPVLKKVLKEAAKHPGLVMTKPVKK
ncbi:MAG: DUF1801 domain-containing protein [Ilumatobacteraceae bacterium]